MVYAQHWRKPICNFYPRCIRWCWGDNAMNPCELTATITALANAIAANSTVDELNLIGVIFTQLGDTLITIATQRSICCSTDSKKEA